MGIFQYNHTRDVSMHLLERMTGCKKHSLDHLFHSIHCYYLWYQWSKKASLVVQKCSGDPHETNKSKQSSRQWAQHLAGIGFVLTAPSSDAVSQHWLYICNAYDFLLYPWKQLPLGSRVAALITPHLSTKHCTSLYCSYAHNWCRSFMVTRWIYQKRNCSPLPGGPLEIPRGSPLVSLLYAWHIIYILWQIWGLS